MGELRISDHAMLRFLGRAAGFDVDRKREELGAALQRAAHAAATIGVETYLVTVDGFCFVVRKSVVTTMLRDTDEAARWRALYTRPE